jgi:hypothetical protein
MDTTFSLSPRTWRVLFLFSRSPLVRRSDRIEVLVIALAVAISLLAVPFIAAIATDVYHDRRGVYAEQARTSHHASTPAPQSTNVAPASLYQARVGGPVGRNATGQRGLAESWVDDAGSVTPPTPPSQAAYDAVGMAVLSEGLAVTIAAALVVGTRWQLRRIRHSQWDRELSSVLGNDGGRSHGGGRSR